VLAGWTAGFETGRGLTLFAKLRNVGFWAGFRYFLVEVLADFLILAKKARVHFVNK